MELANGNTEDAFARTEQGMIDRFSFLAADTLRRNQQGEQQNVIPKAQHRFYTMV